MDNVSELTARTNDEGWTTVFEGWLKGSRLGIRDAVIVFSVGGGQRTQHSANLVFALITRRVSTPNFGIVGRDGGYTARMADACVIVPTVNSATVTRGSFQAVVWHMIVSARSYGDE